MKKDEEDDDKSAEGSLVVNKCEDDLGDTIDAAGYKIGVNPEGPANAKVKNEKSTKKKVTVSWSKVNKANGYEVWKAAKNGNFKKVKTFQSAKTVK